MEWKLELERFDKRSYVKLIASAPRVYLQASIFQSSYSLLLSFYISVGVVRSKQRTVGPLSAYFERDGTKRVGRRKGTLICNKYHKEGADIWTNKRMNELGFQSQSCLISLVDLTDWLTDWLSHSRSNRSYISKLICNKAAKIVVYF